MTACAADRDHAVAVAAATGLARADLCGRLAHRPELEVLPGASANFVLARGTDGLAERLAAQAIAARPCGSFPGLSDAYIRITVRDPATHEQLTAAL